MRRLVWAALTTCALAVTLSTVSMQSVASAQTTNCFPGEMFCSNIEVQVKDRSEDECMNSIGISLFGNPFSDCTIEEQQATEQLDPVGQAVQDAFDGVQKYISGWAASMATFILVDELGGNDPEINPVLDCKTAQGKAAVACADQKPWFIEQFSIMRSIGIFLVVPLFFVMVIQSVVRGSLHMLLRGALIMLPLSVFGTVLIVALMQLLLNISDDFSNYIAAKTVTDSSATCVNSAGEEVTGPTCAFTNSIVEASVGGGGTFESLIWFLVLGLGSVVIWLELVARQIGIYMMSLLMPLGFASFVWGRAAGIGKKLITTEIALIAAKPVTAAAISLGLRALAHQGSTDGAPAASGAESAGTNGGIQAVMVGSLIILLAAYASGKIVMLSPAAAAEQNKILNKNTIWSRGQGANAIAGQVMRVMGNRNAKMQATGTWDAKNGNIDNDAKTAKVSTGGPGPNGGGPASATRSEAPAPPAPAGGAETQAGRDQLRQGAEAMRTQADAMEGQAAALRAQQPQHAARLEAQAQQLRETADNDIAALDALDTLDRPSLLDSIANIQDAAGMDDAAAQSRRDSRTTRGQAIASLDKLEQQGKLPTWAAAARKAINEKQQTKPPVPPPQPAPSSQAYVPDDWTQDPLIDTGSARA